jgi:hypothetical protein
MFSKTLWARIAALAVALAIGVATLPSGITHAQDESLAQHSKRARAGEDGTTGTGADGGNTTTGDANRDKNGNGGNATAGEGGQTDTSGSGGSDTTNSGPPPENADVLEALGVLDVAEQYNLNILTGLNIPIELLPPPPAETTAPVTDVNTGGQGTSGESTGGGTTDGAPAGGSTTTTAEDGAGSSANGEKKHDRAEKHADDAAASGTDTGTGG